MVRYVVLTKKRKRRSKPGIRENQSHLCSKGGAPAHVECEVQFSLGACHALQKWQRKIPENSPRSSRKELSSISKPAVKYVGIDNARSALQTRPGLKRFPLHSLAGDVAVGTVAVVTLRTVCCLLYTSPSPRDQRGSRMPSSA